MLYRGHLAAGIAVGAGTALLARWAGLADTAEEQLILFGLGVAFSLLPDLDTASIAQRWFYRCMVVALVYLMATRRWEQAALLGVFSLLPLVHKHRGWMHSWLAALVVPLACLLIWDGTLLALVRPWPGFAVTVASLKDEVIAGFPRLLAMMAGYAAHVTLDLHGPPFLRLGRLL